MPSRKKCRLKQVEGNERIVRESDAIKAVITVAKEEHPSTFNRHRIQKLMGGHYDTISKALDALDLEAPISLGQVKKVYALYKLLAYFRGNTQYTRAVMAQVVKDNQHEQLLKHKNFDLNTEFNKKANEYFRKDHQQFRNRRRNPEECSAESRYSETEITVLFV